MLDLLFFHLNINFHNIEGELILNILTDIVTVLTVTVAHSEVPQILNFSKVLYDEKVVLIRFRYAVSGPSGSS